MVACDTLGSLGARHTSVIDLLVLGGSGLLGHTLWRHARAAGLRPAATLRRAPGETPAQTLWNDGHIVEGFDARSPGRLGAVLDALAPRAIVNCIGVTKALVAATGEAAVRAVNSSFPHQAAALAVERQIPFIHISTDCVFSGRRGLYRETDAADGDDLYGRSKAAGEPSGPGVLTLRTSFVGRELAGHTGLLEWFLSKQRQRVQGYRRAKFSGLSSDVLADVIIRLIEQPRGLEGLYHVASDPIDKDSLLRLFNAAFDARVEIEAVDGPDCDRTLDGSRFTAATGFVAPSWPMMVEGLRAGSASYRAWRGEA